MIENDVTIDQFFFDWRGGYSDRSEYLADGWQAFRQLVAPYSGARGAHPYWSGEMPCSMHIDEVESIWSAIAGNDDWKPLQDKVAAIRAMGEALAPAPEIAGLR